MNNTTHFAKVSPATGRYVVECNGLIIADTTQAIQLSESYHSKIMNPVIYFPRQSVNSSYLVATNKSTLCPIKGEANYYALQTETCSIDQIAWSYQLPMKPLEPIAAYLAFYLDKTTLSHYD
ncbi:MAG: hypothetical protein ACI89U_001588 [Gammaproteobacteria bacterium]|jgi:uncharacterized protein (DUF427 family)